MTTTFLSVCRVQTVTMKNISHFKRKNLQVWKKTFNPAFMDKSSCVLSWNPEAGLDTVTLRGLRHLHADPAGNTNRFL